MSSSPSMEVEEENTNNSQLQSLPFDFHPNDDPFANDAMDLTLHDEDTLKKEEQTINKANEIRRKEEMEEFRHYGPVSTKGKGAKKATTKDKGKEPKPTKRKDKEKGSNKKSTTNMDVTSSSAKPNKQNQPKISNYEFVFGKDAGGDTDSFPDDDEEEDEEDEEEGDIQGKSTTDTTVVNVPTAAASKTSSTENKSEFITPKGATFRAGQKTVVTEDMKAFSTAIAFSSSTSSSVSATGLKTPSTTVPIISRVGPLNLNSTDFLYDTAKDVYVTVREVIVSVTCTDVRTQVGEFDTINLEFERLDGVQDISPGRKGEEWKFPEGTVLTPILASLLQRPMCNIIV